MRLSFVATTSRTTDKHHPADFAIERRLQEVEQGSIPRVCRTSRQSLNAPLSLLA